MVKNDRFEIKGKTHISRTTIHVWGSVLFGLPSEEIYRTRLKERPTNYWELELKTETDEINLTKNFLVPVYWLKLFLGKLFILMYYLIVVIKAKVSNQVLTF